MIENSKSIFQKLLSIDGFIEYLFIVNLAIKLKYNKKKELFYISVMLFYIKT